MRKQTKIVPPFEKGVRGITYVFFLLILTVTLSSCSPQKQLERLIKKHPELLIKDTVKTSVMVPIPAKNAEFQINYTYRDTLITTYAIDSISHDTIRLTYSVTNDSLVKVYITVPPDTITVPVSVPVDKIQYIKPDDWGLLIQKIPYMAIAIIALVLGGFFFQKK